MPARSIAATLISLLVFASHARCQEAGNHHQRRFAGIDSALGVLGAMHERIKDMNPLLADLHPVAVLDGDSLHIFDTDSTGTSYGYQRTEPAPFPMQKGIRASFPLSCYGNKPTCVVSPEVFDSREGYATVFHEFVHCAQALSCENSLKQTLHVARAAFAAKDYSWEINHSFPYTDSAFAGAYSRFLSGLRDRNPDAVFAAVRELKRSLKPDDYEYMVWVEWKEGLARYFENKIRTLYSLAPNRAGRDRPYDRVCFYSGGEGLIGFLATREGGSFPAAEKLFPEMIALPDGK